jgi:tellurite methyltransferase
MSIDDQVRWDRQHGQNPGDHKPAAFLKRVLESDRWDIRRGRAEKGFAVTGIDISPVALEIGARQSREKALAIVWQHADLERYQLAEGSYDLIVNINYLQRSLMLQIKSALKPGGLIVFESYLIDQASIGHPKNPAYLLAHNELLESFRDCRVLCYREGKFTDGGEPAFRAGIFAQKVK